MKSGLYARAGVRPPQRRGMGEAVRGADDEVVEGVAAVRCYRRGAGHSGRARSCAGCEVRAFEPASGEEYHGFLELDGGEEVFGGLVEGRHHLQADAQGGTHGADHGVLDEAQESCLDPVADEGVGDPRRYFIVGHGYWCDSS